MAPAQTEDPKPLRAPSTLLLALPNLLTLSRLPLAALIWVAPSAPTWVLSVVAVAGIKNLLDGWVARRIRTERWRKNHHPGSFAAGTGRGAFLDPICDKVFVVSLLIAVTHAYAPDLRLVFAVATREILMAPAMLVFATMDGPWKRGHDFTAGWLGKLTTVLQFAAVVALLLYTPAFPALALACVPSGVLAVAVYTRRAFSNERHHHDEPDDHGGHQDDGDAPGEAG